MTTIFWLICFIINLYSTLINGDDLDTLPHILLLGCYSTKFQLSKELRTQIKSHYFGWESCMLLCSSKDTHYAGIQKEGRYCYCSNFLLELSSRLRSSQCSSWCHGDLKRSCGGRDAMTVYSVKNDSTPSFLMMTTHGISHIKDISYTSSLLIPIFIESRYKTGLNYHYKKNQIYFLANQKLYRSNYEFSLSKYRHPKEIIPKAEHVTCFTIDWVRDKLYLGHWQPGPGEGHILATDLQGSGKTVVTVLLNVIKIEIDPYSRKLLILTSKNKKNNGLLVIYDLESNTQKKMNVVGRELAVDHLKKEAFLISGDKLLKTSYLSNQQPTSFLNYNRNKMRSLMALNGDVFHSQPGKDSLDGVFHIKVYSRSPTPYESIRLFTSKQPHLQAMRFFHEINQLPDEDYQCKKKKCSHTCVHRILIQADCVCPNYMFLDSDDKTCKRITNSEVDQTDQRDADGSFGQDGLDDIKAKEKMETDIKKTETPRNNTNNETVNKEIKPNKPSDERWMDIALKSRTFGQQKTKPMNNLEIFSYDGISNFYNKGSQPVKSLNDLEEQVLYMDVEGGKNKNNIEV